MAIAKNRQISKEKEVFMAICLISGIISYQTVRRMKKDWGEVKVKNGIIQTLVADNYIIKISSLSEKHGKQYGYQLTPEGLEYFKNKCPNKYDYTLYAKGDAYKYDAATKYRGYQSSMILYTLYKMGVELSDHTREASNIMNGYEETVKTPFFITTKEMKALNIRFKSIYGDRIFGFIISKTKIVAVYAPDKEHNLLLGRENRLINAVTNVLKYTMPPYNNPKNFEFLYLYNSYADVVDSFSLVNKINKLQAATYRVYKEYKYKTSHIIFMDNNPYTIWDVLDQNYKNEIDDIFWDYYDLEEYHINKLNALYINAVRITQENKHLPTVICWDLSPSAIVSTIEYCKEMFEEADKEKNKAETNENQEDEKILLLCFKEQTTVLEKIVNLNKSSKRHIVIGSLSSESVYDYLEGKIDHIS